MLKLNAIVDVAVIEALYRAAQAGVDLELIIRGACSIQPGLPGVSDRIRVRSIIGEFLEHSRIWGFENGGDREWYIGSADLMDRNLDRRIEAVAPVEDAEARARLSGIIDVMLADDRRSWQLQPDASWVRTETLLGRAGTVDTFESLKEDALEPKPGGGDPAPPGRRRRFARSAGMSQDVARPVEVELKYRVVDQAGAERYLVADQVGSFTAGPAARASQFEDRYVDTADGALARAGFAVRLRRSGRDTVVSVKALARTEGAGRIVPARGARRAGGPNRRADRLAGIGRPLPGPRAGRRRAARGTRHDPPAPPQAGHPRRTTRGSS